VVSTVVSCRVLNLKDVADIVGVPAAQLRLWLDAGKVTASTAYTSNQRIIGSETVYLFEESDIAAIRQFAKAHSTKRNNDQFVDDGQQETFTVAQVAQLWQLSPDTIQRIFQDEPGVLPLGSARF
jgi:hypothetical protein